MSANATGRTLTVRSAGSNQMRKSKTFLRSMINDRTTRNSLPISECELGHLVTQLVEEIFSCLVRIVLFSMV